MNIISIHCTNGSMSGSSATARLTARGLQIKFSRLFQNAKMLVRYEGAALAVIDSKHSMGKVAAGAIVGGVLLGPLGAIAGGALGGDRKHTVVIASLDARVVLEVSTPELQELLGLGLCSWVDNVSVQGRLPLFTFSIGAWLLMLAIVVIAVALFPRFMLTMMAITIVGVGADVAVRRHSAKKQNRPPA